MASISLVESAKLDLDVLVTGVIEEIITVNQMFSSLPFDGISGNSIQYNRENVIGGVGIVGVGDAWDSTDRNPITGETGGMRDPSTVTAVFSGLTTIGGDAEVNGLIQATRSNHNDQAQLQISSKAKHCGRVFQSEMINGDGSGDRFEGLINLCATAQTVTAATNGQILSFDGMDEVGDLVTAKDGMLDYYLMNKRLRREFRTLLRGLGGAAIGETLALPGGGEIMAYNAAPIFRNDWIPVDQDQGTSTGVASTVFAGVFDDGSRRVGLAGLTAENQAGIEVQDVGISQTKDEHIWRVIWYVGLALFSEKGLACAPGMIPVP